MAPLADRVHSAVGAQLGPNTDLPRFEILLRSLLGLFAEHLTDNAPEHLANGDRAQPPTETAESVL